MHKEESLQSLKNRKIYIRFKYIFNLRETPFRLNVLFSDDA